jgi:hypothetical protein
MAWLGFASGDIFAAGPSCGASEWVTVARWSKTASKPELISVSRGRKVIGDFTTISGKNADSVTVHMPDADLASGHVWSARFDGKRWSSPVVEPNRGEALLAMAPRGRKGRRWDNISSVVEAPSGDVWMTAREHRIDCGRCFMYDALLRIRKRTPAAEMTK